MSTESIILLGVIIYIIIMVAVALYAAKKTHSVTEFIVAGRSLPLWLCTASIVATWFGGAIMIGGAGAAYDEGLLGNIADPFGASLCLFLIGMFFVRLIRRLKVFTFIEFVEQRFGRAAGLISSAGSLMSLLFWTSGMLVAFGVVFETLTGIPLVVGIVGGALIVILYTMIGGMLAVALTDAVQMLVIAVGLIGLLVVVIVDSGGWTAISAQLPEHTFRMIPIENTPERWLTYLRAWVIFGLADIASQSLFGRALSAKSEKVAQDSFYIGTFLYLAFGMIPVMLGIIGSATLPGLANSEAIVPSLALEHLHPVAIAVFVGAILAAIMSSCDSALLGAASVMSTNILPALVKNPSEKLQLRVVRWGVPFGGLIAVAGALNAQVVFNTMLDANMLMLAAIIAPFILGIWWKKANRAGALAAMTMGIAFWLATPFFHDNLPGDLIGLGVSLITMLIVTPLTQKIDPPRELRDTDGNVVELTNRLGLLR